MEFFYNVSETLYESILAIGYFFSRTDALSWLVDILKGASWAFQGTMLESFHEGFIKFAEQPLYIVLLSSGLTFFLTYRLIKWILDIVF